MWKWIAGGALVLIVLVMGTCYYGLKKLTAGGDSITVMVGVTPDRVFASLANPDSLATWVDVGSTVTSKRHGLFETGDSFDVVRPSVKTGGRPDESHWVVLNAIPGHSLLLQISGDSLQKFARITRHDSLEAVGDSTRLTVTYAAEIVDSTRLPARDSGKAQSAAMGFGEKLIVAALRLASETDVQRLKARVEKH